MICPPWINICAWKRLLVWSKDSKMLSRRWFTRNHNLLPTNPPEIKTTAIHAPFFQNLRNWNQYRCWILRLKMFATCTNAAFGPLPPARCMLGRIGKLWLALPWNSARETDNSWRWTNHGDPSTHTWWTYAAPVLWKQQPSQCIWCDHLTRFCSSSCIYCMNWKTFMEHQHCRIQRPTATQKTRNTCTEEQTEHTKTHINWMMWHMPNWMINSWTTARTSYSRNAPGVKIQH